MFKSRMGMEIAAFMVVYYNRATENQLKATKPVDFQRDQLDNSEDEDESLGFGIFISLCQRISVFFYIRQRLPPAASSMW